MNRVAHVAQLGVAYDEARNAYEDTAVTWCTKHDLSLPGRKRAAAYAAAVKCRRLVEELEIANDELIVALRALR